MSKFSWLPTSAAVCLAIIAAGCGSTIRQDRPSTSPQAPVALADVTPADPIDELIAESERLYDEGQRELERGHLEQARDGFDRALEVLLEAPGGARGEPRLRDQFDRLVDRISALDVAALATGDGFAEKQTSEPATIDEILALSATFDKPVPTRALTELVETDLAQTAHDIPIPLNRRVLAYVELFQGRLRPFIQEGLERGGQYLPMIQQVFRAEGLPLDLAYIPLIESAFKPSALSRARARGVWQFMSATAKENGLTYDWYVDERSDPAKATRAAAQYLRTLYKMFDGDWHLALASYNGGPGRVGRAMKRSGRDDFWSLSASTRYLPRETREYVPMVLAAIIIARNPSQYGFEAPTVDKPFLESITVYGPVDLRRIAEWANVPVDVIHELNPELRRWTTPVKEGEYLLNVPYGTALIVQMRLAGSTEAERSALNWHTVRRGESLSLIARKLGVRRTDLALANYISPRARLSTGQQLVIPRAPATLMAARPDRRRPASASGTARPDVERASLVEPARSEDATPVKHVYRVKRGDTLIKIARLFDTSVAALKQWNGLNSSRINRGQRLTVYTTADLAR
jgi:membrane-bound lytic murein transglycosylase D